MAGKADGRKPGMNIMAMAIAVLLLVAVLYLGARPQQSNAYSTTTVYNTTTTTTTNQSATLAVNLQQELNNSTSNGFSLNQTVFYSNSTSECSLQLIALCDNNEPGQFICVNSQYSALVESQYKSVYSNSSGACPLFLLAGTVNCGVQAGYCVVLHSQPN